MEPSSEASLVPRNHESGERSERGALLAPKVPSNTYRLQISADFDLDEATRQLAYLHDLGVDWVYLSPLLPAEPGSNHGYDVVAHDTVDPTRGGPDALARLSLEARRLGLGVLVDIVPNHVGVATPALNAWWWDLLAHGRESAYAAAFDVDWEAGGGRLLIPVVGVDDESAVEVADGEVRYHDHRFPLAPGTSTLDEQHYRLVSWRAADDRLNYRRFFAVNTLAGIRVEEQRVFDATHVEIRRWFDEGLVDGLRVDHPDGLRDPRGYLDRLAGLTGGAYVLVEKILEPGESLPMSWATAGTTGYDVLGQIDRVLTDPAAADLLPYGDVDWHQLIHDTKRAVADGILGSEVRRIVRDLGLPVVEEVAPAPISKPREPATLVDAVAELLACFPVYRSYLPEGRADLEAAFASARGHRPDLEPAFSLLEPILGDEAHSAALRFQQTSGMVMAKGVEDCAFYRFDRLTSLNEVGGDPSEFSLSVTDFHEAMAIRHRNWPHAMTCTSTHDTKRGEDVRARISVLAEVPEVWTSALDRFLTLAPLPDPAFGSLLWQAILGAWPASPQPDLRSRLHGYAEKAMREAGDHTTWTAPDAAYESAVHAAVDTAFHSAEVGEVLEGLLSVVVQPGWSNSLAAKLVALTIPGVPDVYQGSELAEQSLVDPDNRRPVAFDHRAAVLAGGAHDPALPKLRITSRALLLRRDRPELFTTYAEVPASGSAADHVLAFDRGGAVTVATRLPVGLAKRGGWEDTTLHLPDGEWRDELTDVVATGPAALRSLLSTYPVALLTREF